MALLLAPCILQAGDIKVGTAVRKRVDAVAAKPGAPGDERTSSEKWRYEVQIVNGGFKAAPALKAKYIVFVQRQELGGKAGTDPVEKSKGEADVAALLSHGTGSFTTNEILLKGGSLVGEYHFRNGGRVKVQDVIQGIWIKLFDGTTEVCDYANPRTITGRNKWEE